jgi:ribose transport system substrate-binding protein
LDLLDPALNGPVMAAVLAAGISIVAFDSVAPESLGILSIGNDFHAQATMAAERLVELMGGTGKVAIMQGVPTAPNHRIRYEAHKAVFAKYPGIEVVAEGIDQDDLARAQAQAQAQAQAEAILAAHPDLGGFVSCNASGPIGIGRAIAKAGLTGQVHTVGIDDLDPLLSFWSAHAPPGGGPSVTRRERGIDRGPGCPLGALPGPAEHAATENRGRGHTG